MAYKSKILIPIGAATIVCLIALIVMPPFSIGNPLWKRNLSHALFAQGYTEILDKEVTQKRFHIKFGEPIFNSNGSQDIYNFIPKSPSLKFNYFIAPPYPRTDNSVPQNLLGSLTISSFPGCFKLDDMNAIFGKAKLIEKHNTAHVSSYEYPSNKLPGDKIITPSAIVGVDECVTLLVFQEFGQ